jgi:hypothetical protein
VSSVRNIKANEVKGTDEFLFDGGFTSKVYEAVILAAEQGDIISAYSLTSGKINVDIRIPVTHRQAMKSHQAEKWRQAETEEFK